jgi:galactokinase
MIKVSTPGRICLFGEHQDYLGLPIIAAAISRRISVEGTYDNSGLYFLRLPDIKSTYTIKVEKRYTYKHSRDYYRSALNILKKNGVTLPNGLNAKVLGNIPINSGTSSSSALIISWIHFLLKFSDHPIDLKLIAEWAYLAEVDEFGESGGMMDHYSTALGNIIYLESQPKIEVEFLKPQLGTFVLGDSEEPKDTVGILKRVKKGVLAAVDKIKKQDSTFSLFSTSASELDNYKGFLSKEEMELITGNLDNRNILIEALSMLKSPEMRHVKLGDLLNRHQFNLRENLKISTPKIDKMLQASLDAGALGGKINGSGGGGCMFVYAPENPQKIAQAIESQGGKAFIISVDEGTRVEI